VSPCQQFTTSINSLCCLTGSHTSCLGSVHCTYTSMRWFVGERLQTDVMSGLHHTMWNIHPLYGSHHSVHSAQCTAGRGGEFEALASWNSWPDDDDIMTTANFSNKVTTSVLLTAICTCFLQDCCRRHCHLWAQVQKTSLHHWSIGPGTLKNTVLTLEAASHFVRPQPSPTRVCLLYLRPIDICHSSGYRPACIAS